MKRGREEWPTPVEWKRFNWAGGMRGKARKERGQETGDRGQRAEGREEMPGIGLF
ncbi:hypothetical protein [Desulfonatronovibrio magnus]|uniref:hypothetical protein n=1 Tax=Desulfonatronovibrio magnus TaxID=698827 RepID=UPI0018DE26EE|nr:hypothetical protein [Desulfonatronovibrio magnus]